MGLATHRHDRTEPRVPTKDQPQKRGPASLTEELRFDQVDKRRGHVLLAVPRGVTFSDHVDKIEFGNSSASARARTDPPVLSRSDPGGRQLGP
jgi:hypothetical protein